MTPTLTPYTWPDYGRVFVQTNQQVLSGPSWLIRPQFVPGFLRMNRLRILLFYPIKKLLVHSHYHDPSFCENGNNRVVLFYLKTASYL